MKKALGILSAFVFLFCIWGTSVLAADPSAEMEQLKQEVNKLLKKIDDLEKKQTETETKAEEAQKKAIEVEKKAGETEKKFAEVEKKTDTFGKKFKLDLSAQVRAFYLSRDEGKWSKPDGRSKTCDYRSNYFEIYKFRLSTKGEVGKLIQFYAMVEGWLADGPRVIGLTAGASTPNGEIERVVRRIVELRGVEIPA